MQRVSTCILALGLAVAMAAPAHAAGGMPDFPASQYGKFPKTFNESLGGDIVMSPEFCADPLVTEALSRLEIREESADLKGFDRPMRFFRVPPAAVADARLGAGTA